MRNIGKAKKEDVESILKLYKSQLGEPFCAWDDGYPCEENIADDLSRESLFIMKDGNGDILAAISVDQDENVENLTCWTPELQPGADGLTHHFIFMSSANANCMSRHFCVMKKNCDANTPKEILPTRRKISRLLKKLIGYRTKLEEEKWKL